MGVVQKIRY